MLSEDLALGMIANNFGVDETAQIELLGSEHRHDGKSSHGPLSVKLSIRR